MCRNPATSALEPVIVRGEPMYYCLARENRRGDLEGAAKGTGIRCLAWVSRIPLGDPITMSWKRLPSSVPSS